MMEYIRRMRELALMQEYLPAAYMKGEGYNRDVQDLYAALPPQSEEVICRAIVKGLPYEFQHSVVTRWGASDYQNLTREEFEDLLEEIGRAEQKKQPETLARKQSDLDDANTENAPAWQKRAKKKRKKRAKHMAEASQSVCPL